MGVLLRIFLFVLVVYLIFQSIASYGAKGTSQSSGRKSDPINPDKGKRTRGVSKEVGEYVDYEEVKDE